MKNIKEIALFFIKVIIFSPGIVALIVFFYGFAKNGDLKCALAFLGTLFVFTLWASEEDSAKHTAWFFQVLSVYTIIKGLFEYVCLVLGLDFFIKHLCKFENPIKAIYYALFGFGLLLIISLLSWLIKKLDS